MVFTESKDMPKKSQKHIIYFFKTPYVMLNSACGRNFSEITSLVILANIIKVTQKAT